MLTVGHIHDWLNAIAPFETAEGFDNVGLLIGSRDQAVNTVLFGLDLNEQLAEEAVRRGAQLIVTHHPFIFHGVKRIDYTGPQGRTLCALMNRRIAVIAAHTNWDRAPGGVSDSLAQALGLADVSAADPYVRVGSLPSPLSPDAFARHIAGSLRIVPRCYRLSDAPIERVAVAGGAYGEGWEAALAARAQAYVVGEIGYHHALEACERGLMVCDAGHYPTELPGAVALYRRFAADAQSAGWPVQAYLHDQAPYKGALLVPSEGMGV